MQDDRSTATPSGCMKQVVGPPDDRPPRIAAAAAAAGGSSQGNIHLLERIRCASVQVRRIRSLGVHGHGCMAQLRCRVRPRALKLIAVSVLLAQHLYVRSICL